MSIRNAAKAIIIHDDKVLVNKCKFEKTGHIYYDLPGGGQLQFETMEEAVIREVLEETGYKIKVVRFVALAEEIYNNEELRKKYLDYSHRVLHIFLAKIIDCNPGKPTETDFQQEESLWLTFEEADKIDFLPKQLSGKISMLITETNPRYLGCSYVL